MAMTPFDLTLLLERIETAANQRCPALKYTHSRPKVSAEERLQAAMQLRERLCRAPWYARKAAEAAVAGDEMSFWMALQSSQATAHRP